MIANVASVLLGLFVVVLTIALLILIKKRGRVDQRLTAGDILQLLNEFKHIRLDADKRWELHEVIQDHRVWISRLGIDEETSGLLKAPILLYGCFHCVKASAQDVLATLSSAKKYVEWDPDMRDIQIISQPKESKIDLAAKPPQTTPVKHDIISARSHFVANMAIQILNTTSYIVQGVPFVQRRKTIYRIWHREENGCCWLLEHEDQHQEWTFYLAQSIDGWFGKDQCLLTIICHPHPLRGRDCPARAPYKMNALVNLFQHQKLKCAPLLSLTLPSAHAADEPSSSAPAELTDSGQLSEAEIIEAKPELKTVKSEPNFIQKFKKMVEEKKEQYDREKSLKKRRMEALAAAQKDTIKDILHHSVEAGVNVPDGKDYDPAKVEEEEEDEEEKGLEAEEEDVISLSTSSTEDVYKDKKASIMNLFNKGTGEDGKPRQWGDHMKQRLRMEFKKVSKSLEGSIDLAESCESISLGGDEDRADASTPLLDRKNSTTFEYEQPPEIELEERVAGMRVQAGQVIEEIMKEKSCISQINISLSPEDQSAKSGGWIYIGHNSRYSALEKDIVILKKVTDESAVSPVFSYLGKGIIDCPPEKVFAKLQNPQTRFTYDEQLKKTEVLQDLGNGLKIVYMHHQLTQLFKREGHDLCVLQCERHRATQDSGVSAYALGMESVDWPEFQGNEDVPRAKLLPSGWIVEPIVREDNIHSMVTYIISLEATNGQGSTALEELASKQPSAIAALRQYLTLPPVSPQAALKVSPGLSNVSKSKKNDGEQSEKQATPLHPDIMC